MGDADDGGVPEFAFVSEEEGVHVHGFEGSDFRVESERWLPDIARDLAWGDVDGERGNPTLSLAPGITPEDALVGYVVGLLKFESSDSSDDD